MLAISLLLLSNLMFRIHIHYLEKAIKKHRDCIGNDRCWLDDEKLYRELNDHKHLSVLPPEEIFLDNCKKFYQNRQHPFQKEIFYGKDK